MARQVVVGMVLRQRAKITSFDAGGLIAPVDPAQKKLSLLGNLQIKDGKYQREEPKTGFSCNSTFFYAPSGFQLAMEKRRVFQFATGNVGSEAVDRILEDPDLELNLEGFGK